MVNVARMLCLCDWVQPAMHSTDNATSVQTRCVLHIARSKRKEQRMIMTSADSVKTDNDRQKDASNHASDAAAES